MNSIPFPNAFGREASAEVAAAALARLLSNVPGFVYRSRPDAQRTMEFVSDHCRDLTGYDPHRFIGNQSLTYASLIHPADRARVDRTVFGAAARGRRFTCGYRLQTAYGGFIEVMDRGVGVLDETGALCAIEGYIYRADGVGQWGEIDSPGVMAEDDATSELVDRMLRTHTPELSARAHPSIE